MNGSLVLDLFSFGNRTHNPLVDNPDIEPFGAFPHFSFSRAVFVSPEHGEEFPCV